jgi:SAM-dependent methyltransferase
MAASEVHLVEPTAYRYEPETRLLGRLRTAIRGRRFLPTVWKYFKSTFRGGLAKVRHTLSPEVLTLDGSTLRYFTRGVSVLLGDMDSERIVEVPFVLQYVSGAAGAEILEVGNVLHRFVNFPHEVLDKYEQAPGVMNADAESFNPGRRYDLIVSVSTLEHIGFDEFPREAGKLSRAIHNLQRLLKPGGVLVFTCPLGYNPELDALLSSSSLLAKRQFFVRRISILNLWTQVTLMEGSRHRYAGEFRFASSLALVELGPPEAGSSID